MYNKLNEVQHGKDELPPMWIDIQENIEDRIQKIDEQCNPLYSYLFYIQLTSLKICVYRGSSHDLMMKKTINLTLKLTLL